MNLLKAIYNLHNHREFELSTASSGSNNRANHMGDALEEFVKNMFANSFNENTNEKMSKFENLFSYAGNSNNPPDFILKQSDAFEVKKLETTSYNDIALNSSHPKNKLYANDPRISNECRECEEWTEKDIFYTIGHIKDSYLKELWIVDGMCISANKSIYSQYVEAISTTINQIPSITFTETNELGKINKADPLGATYLRIRGMWGIKHPAKIFDYLKFEKKANFNLYCLIRKEKFDAIDEDSKKTLSSIGSNNLSISEKKVKNPNNTAKTINIKLIHYGQ